jgi:putative FmdB family regulatory protein
MPVYEYQCSDCTKKFELFVPQRMNTAGVVCRNCHSTEVRKLVSSFASIGGDAEQTFNASSSSGGGCCGGAGGCACGH